jgi:hypothetical protein
MSHRGDCGKQNVRSTFGAEHSRWTTQPYLWAEVNEDRQRQGGDERRTELKPPSDGTSLCYGNIGAESEEDTEGGLRGYR